MYQQKQSKKASVLILFIFYTLVSIAFNIFNIVLILFPNLCTLAYRFWSCVTLSAKIFFIFFFVCFFKDFGNVFYCQLKYIQIYMLTFESVNKMYFQFEKKVVLFPKYFAHICNIFCPEFSFLQDCKYFGLMINCICKSLWIKSVL